MLYACAVELAAFLGVANEELATLRHRSRADHLSIRQQVGC